MKQFLIKKLIWMITSGEEKTKVWLKKQKIGDDVLLIVGGGEKNHIGAAIMCTPGGKTRVLKYGSHKDHIVLKSIAEKACEKYKRVVVAVGGIHIKNASEKEINQVVENCERLEECI
ncbi:MAG: hypothetical protein V5A64_07330 [Candidatus Thermoplasmatota archaeon]